MVIDPASSSGFYCDVGKHMSFHIRLKLLCYLLDEELAVVA